MTFFDELLSEVSKAKETIHTTIKIKPPSATSTPRAAKSKQPAAYSPIETKIARYCQETPIKKTPEPIKGQEDDKSCLDIEGRERKRPGQGKRQAAPTPMCIIPRSPTPPSKVTDIKGKKRAREDDDKEPFSPSRKVKSEHNPPSVQVEPIGQVPDEEAFTRLFGSELLGHDGSAGKPAGESKVPPAIPRLTHEQLALSKQEAQILSARVATRKDLTSEQKEDFRKLGLPKAKVKKNRIEENDITVALNDAIAAKFNENARSKEENIGMEKESTSGEDEDEEESESEGEEPTDMENSAAASDDDDDDDDNDDAKYEKSFWGEKEPGAENTDEKLSAFVAVAAAKDHLMGIKASKNVVTPSSTVNTSIQSAASSVSSPKRKRSLELGSDDDCDLPTSKKQR